MNSKLKNFVLNYWVLVITVAVKFTLQYVLVNPVYELHRDEFLHLDQAKHLAFGYISVPPLTSLFSKMIFLLGGGLFWIRFFPALFGALTLVFTWLIIESLGGKLFSKILVSCGLLFSALVRLNILFQPNSFDILIWTVIFWMLVNYIKSNDSKWLWFLSVMVALALYNKYTPVFLLAGLLAGLLLTAQRRIFKDLTLWKAAGLGILLFLPNIIWQIDHHLPVIAHMKVLKANQLDNNSSTGFIMSQIRFFFGSLPVTVFALIAFVSYKPFKPYRFIGICFAVVLAVFTVLKAKDYYAVGLFPVMFAFGATYIEAILSKRWKLPVVSFLIVVNIAVFVKMLRYVFPVLTPSEINSHRAGFEKFGLMRWEDGKNHLLPQDFADMIGWREMADKALLAYQMIPPGELEYTVVFCDNYGQTGALNYYNRGKMKEAFSFNTDYIYWLPHLKEVHNILLVGDKPNEKITALFKECRLTGVVENEFAREKNTEIWLMTGAAPAVTGLFYKLAEDRKNNLDIF